MLELSKVLELPRNLGYIAVNTTLEHFCAPQHIVFGTKIKKCRIITIFRTFHLRYWPRTNSRNVHFWLCYMLKVSAHPFFIKVLSQVRLLTVNSYSGIPALRRASSIRFLSSSFFTTILFPISSTDNFGLILKTSAAHCFAFSS